jgi:hypothetical protein
MESDFNWLARSLESCLWPHDRIPGPGPSSIGEELARAALIFLASPTRSMITAAQTRCPSLTVDQVRDMLKTIAAAILASKLQM